MTAPPTSRSRRRGVARPFRWSFGSVALAATLVLTSLLAAGTFRARPETGEPGRSGSSAPAGPGETTVPWAGPDLYGIFATCNPACDLEIAVKGIARRLTMTDRDVDESAPSLSPDRRHVAFRCAVPGIEPGGPESPRPAGLGSLCLVDTIDPADQSAEVPAVTTVLTAAGVDYGAPAWSPDGSTIAFVSRDADGVRRLGMLDIKRRQARDVAMDPIDPANPAWSADGSMLAFSCGARTAEAGPSTRFCVMPVDGGDVTALDEVAGDCGVPTFMPDGAHLAVVCVLRDAAGGDLFILSLDEVFTNPFTTSHTIAPEG